MDEKKPFMPKIERPDMQDFLDSLPKPVFPIEEKTIIGKNVTVFTIDGKETTGVIQSAPHFGLALKNDTGKIIVFTNAITSIHFHEHEK
jgi:sRNA-binding regulator protein Hfq